jgi:hypothetical protein
MRRRPRTRAARRHLRRPGATSIGRTREFRTSALADLAALEELIPTEPPLEIPDASRRPTDFVGVLDERWSLGTDAYGNANGRFLSTLMRRLDAPIPSRWGHILLRRALLTRGPGAVLRQPVDWVAERAWLLLRMGEADGARMLVQAVDVDQFTPKMFAIAVQTGLATSDPAALCPLVEPGSKTSDEPVWPLADAMCAAMSGEPTRASTAIDRARRRSRLDVIDIDLAEKVIGSGANTRRAVTIKWDDVGQVNSWRFGLASATGYVDPGASDERRRAPRPCLAGARADDSARRTGSGPPMSPPRSASFRTSRWSRCTASFSTPRIRRKSRTRSAAASASLMPRATPTCVCARCGACGTMPATMRTFATLALILTAAAAARIRRRSGSRRTCRS